MEHASGAASAALVRAGTAGTGERLVKVRVVEMLTCGSGIVVAVKEQYNTRTVSRSRRCFSRGNVIQRDDPVPIDLAHQTGVDSVLRVLRPLQLEAADQLRGIGRENLDADVVEAQCPARFR